MSFVKTILPTLNSSRRPITIIAAKAGNRIPKIIHQTSHSQSLPTLIQKNILKLKAMNPGWEYRFYDDDAVRHFISENYGAYILDFYNNINPKYGAARADLFRYLLMYQVGGVYIDIKASMQKPLDDVLMPNDSYLISNWQNKKGQCHEGVGIHRECRLPLKSVHG